VFLSCVPRFFSSHLHPAKFRAGRVQAKKLACDGGGNEEIYVKRAKGDPESEAKCYCQVVLLCG